MAKSYVVTVEESVLGYESHSKFLLTVKKGEDKDEKIHEVMKNWRSACDEGDDQTAGVYTFGGELTATLVEIKECGQHDRKILEKFLGASL